MSEQSAGQDEVAEGWQGTTPAEGTRRALIRDAIGEQIEALDEGTMIQRRELASKLADAVEAALLDAVGHRGCTVCDGDAQRDLAECYRLTGADPSDGSDAMLAREALDEVRRFRAEYDELETANAAVGESLDRIDAPQGATYAERIDRLYRMLLDRLKSLASFAVAQRDSHHTLREEDLKYTEYHRGAELAYALIVERLGGESAAVATGQAWPEGSPERRLAEACPEGKVPPGTRELVIVLEDVSAADQPPEYRFIELEDQDGASVGGFGIKPSSRTPFLEITIPYGRDDAWVSEVAYQAAGAGTRPLMEDHPDYTFPTKRVGDAVAGLLSDFGIARACRPCAEEEIEQGAKEVDGRRDDTIKGLSERCDQLLEQRESARVGEDRFKAQRDASLHLLRWLIGDLIPSHLVDLAEDDS